MLNYYEGIGFKAKDVYFALHPESKSDNLARLKLGLPVKLIPNLDGTTGKKAPVVESWAHVLLLLERTKKRVAVGEFWTKYGSVLEQHLGTCPAVGEESSASNTAAAGRLPPSARAHLTSVKQLADGVLYATSKDYASFKAFQRELELHTATCFTTRRFRRAADFLTIIQLCKYGGKPRWRKSEPPEDDKDENGTTKPSIEQHSGISVRCCCGAYIEARIQIACAEQLGLAKRKRGNVTASILDDGGTETAAPSPSPSAASAAREVNTTVHIWINLQHTNHEPGKLPVDPHIVAKIAELTLQNTPFESLQTQLAEYARELVRELGLDPQTINSDCDVRFYPNTETIRYHQQQANDRARG